MNEDSLQKKLATLEHTIHQAGERVGELRDENRLLTQQVQQLKHQMADKSRQLAVLQQAEEKFMDLQRQTELLKGERRTLKSEVEQLLRKVASLKAAVLQLD